jgi:hypothetical protein
VSQAFVSLVVTTSLWACSSAGDSGTRPGGGSTTGGQTTTGGLSSGIGIGTGSGAGGGASIISGADNEAGAADNCGHKEFNVMRKPAEVLLLLDRSASMEDPPQGGTGSKWSVVVPGLSEVINQTNGEVSWGLKTFPEGEGSECIASSVTDAIDVKIAPMNGKAVTDQIMMTTDKGNGTPTGDAIKHAVTYFDSLKATDANPKYILLATDGEPSCPGGQSTARPYAADAIKAAAMAGYHTFVVGVSTTKATATAALNDMAIAGLEARADPNPLSTKFYLANTKDELVTSLKVITGVVSDCTFPLGEAPPVPENIGVRVGTKLAPKDTTHTDGWDYTGPDNMTVKVYGSWCDQIKTSAANTVQMVFACKGEIIN